MSAAPWPWHILFWQPGEERGSWDPARGCELTSSGERCLSPHVQPPVRSVFTCLRDNVSAFESMFPLQHLQLDDTEWINRLTPSSRFGLCSSAGLFPDPKTNAKPSSRLWWKDHSLHLCTWDNVPNSYLLWSNKEEVCHIVLLQFCVVESSNPVNSGNQMPTLIWLKSQQ